MVQRTVSPSSGSWRGGLIATAFVAPTSAAALSVLLYLAFGGGARSEWLAWVGANALLCGTLLAAALWLVAAEACAFAGFTGSDGANMRQFAELAQRVEWIQCRLARLPLEEGHPGRSRICRADGAKLDEALVNELGASGPQWILGTGYIDAWAHLHRAEEALVEVEEPERVVGWALEDELRLSGSEVPHRDKLLAMLRQAVFVVSSSAEQYLPKQPGTELTVQTELVGRAGRGFQAEVPPFGGKARSAGPTASDGSDGAFGGIRTGVNREVSAVRKLLGTAAPAAQAQMTASDERQARAVLQKVRRSLNEYRDQGWDGLVRARNHCLIAIVVAAATAYLLAGLAVVDRIDHGVLVAAIAFYLTGSLTGLVNLLNGQSQIASEVDDYGLSVVRLLLTALVGGLAGVAGPVIVSTAATALGGAMQGTQAAVPGFADIFKLQPLPVVVAAAFGLTPRLLLEVLQQRAEEVRKQLKSTDSAQTADKKS